MSVGRPPAAGCESALETGSMPRSSMVLPPCSDSHNCPNLPCSWKTKAIKEQNGRLEAEVKLARINLKWMLEDKRNSKLWSKVKPLLEELGDEYKNICKIRCETEEKRSMRVLGDALGELHSIMYRHHEQESLSPSPSRSRSPRR